ncbi:MAG: hypothetical protein WB503_12600, partial [Pseudolabrys sp.]
RLLNGAWRLDHWRRRRRTSDRCARTFVNSGQRQRILATRRKPAKSRIVNDRSWNLLASVLTD